MKKYIYGKEVYLSNWINGYAGIRLSDLASYSFMDNKLMRDNELVKSFNLDKNCFQFSVNGYKLNPDDIVGDITIDVPIERCFCVCLSGKCNDPELFERFKADVCVEIDVAQLVRLLEASIQRFPGSQVIRGDVIYYGEPIIDAGPDFERALFYKSQKYSIENEYRIAIVIPKNRTKVQSVDGDVIELWSDDPSDFRHVFIAHQDREAALSYLSTVYRNPNA